MRRWYEIWGVINVVVLLFTGLAFISMHEYVNNYNKSEIEYYKEDADADVELELQISKQWGEEAHGFAYGLQYDAVLRNHTDEAVNNWAVTLALPDSYRIDSFWNCELADSILSATEGGDKAEGMQQSALAGFSAMEHNTVIPPWGQQTFGFVLYSDSLDNILNYRLTLQKNIAIEDLMFSDIVQMLLLALVILDFVMFFVTIKLRRMEERHRVSTRIINQSFMTFANMIDAKDPYTRGHSLRVAIYSREIARRMDMTKQEQQNIFYIALLHDIGKIGTSDNVLKKQGRLTEDEREEIQQHVTAGGEILKYFEAIDGIADGAKYHHERYDGKGYGFGIKGEEIPLCARIIGVADAFDAMTSERCYRQPMSIEIVKKELKEGAGTQFDPKIVPVMLDMIEDGTAPTVVEENKKLYTELMIHI